MAKQKRTNPSAVKRSNEGDEFQLAAETDTVRYPVHEYLQEAARKNQKATSTKLGPTTLPLLVGVFDFPWQLSTLGCWLPMSLLLLLAGGMHAFLLTYGVQAGMMGVRTIGVSAFIATILAVGYASACCLTTIEQTGDGNVTIDNWPKALQWKEWAWALVFMLVMMAEAALAAFIPTCWIVYWSAIPTVLLTVAVFPIVLLASLEADTWAPTSKPILQSLAKRPLLWVMFYAEYFGVLIVWSVITLLAAVLAQWWALVIACPLLAAIFLIEARLIGRLAWCLGNPA